MAKQIKGQPLVPSLLDRLMSDRRGHNSLRQMRQFIARDLEDLLNSRRWCGLLPEEMEELETSLVNYGLPDFTGVKMSSTVERGRLRKLLEDTIRRNEGRLSAVRVFVVENTDTTDRRMHFRIEATLNVRPAPEPVVFDSSLEPNTANFQVK
jgi:type VI secretion system protein ImpF